MKKTAAILAAICAAFGTCATAHAAASPPDSGSYTGEVYVYSTNGDKTCIDHGGDTFTGQESYAGLSGAIDYIRVPVIGGSPIISVQELKITKGIGTTGPSGNLAWTGTGTTSQVWNVTGTFSETITEVGTHTFLAEIAESYSTCTENLWLSLARVSANQ